MTLKLFLSLGKDLIASKNLLNRHHVIQANIASHEPRIQMITEKGNKMIEEGMYDSNLCQICQIYEKKFFQL